MSKGRLEAFSDGVLAIIITIMVLELKVPHGDDIHSLQALVPRLLAYLVSFVFIGIYWSNHHHLLQAVRHVNGAVLWANLHLLFWLSLVPIATDWVGETHFAPWPVAGYGLVFLLAGVAYYILTRTLITSQGGDSVLAAAVGADAKGSASIALYAFALPLAFVNRWVSCALYVAVAIVWLIPDRRIERILMLRGEEERQGRK